MRWICPRVLVVAWLAGTLLAGGLASTVAVAQTAQGVLHIKVAVRGADQAVTPVPRYALLISDNPNTTTPRRVLTGNDGTVDVRLRGGNYTVESDQPLAFAGKGYQWVQTLDVPAGRDVTLELNERNAEIGPLDGAMPIAAGGAAAPGGGPAAGGRALDTASATDTAIRFAPLQDSLVRLWTPRARASGFLVESGDSGERGDSRLIVTSQKIVGGASRVEVQLAPTTTIEGRIVAADETRDVALIRVDRQAVATLKPIALACEQAMPALKSDQELVALGVPLGAQQDRLVRGNLTRITTREIEADMRLAASAAGGPLFTLDGTLIGLTTLVADDRSSRREARGVPVTSACELLAAATKAIAGSAAPPATPLPLEPLKAFPEAALKDAFAKRGANLQPYQLSSDDFEVAFITPIMNYASQQPEQRTTSRDTRNAQLDQLRLPKWSDFSNWSEYMREIPSVLAVRVTPKLDEKFWTTVMRGAARTQGMNLPPMKHFKSAFASLRLLCGEREVPPIHRLVLESRTALDEAVVEGFYLFDPAAVAPSCASVTLQLFSEKQPEKADSKAVDRAIVDKLWQDFEPLRTP